MKLLKTMAIMSALALSGTALAEETKTPTPAAEPGATQGAPTPATPTPATPTPAAPTTDVKPPVAATPWYETVSFIKTYGAAWSKRFVAARTALEQKREALKTAEAAERAEKDKAKRAALHRATLAARKAFWQAEIAWLRLHIEFKHFQRKFLRDQRAKALREFKQRQEAARVNFIEKDFKPHIAQWQKRIEQIRAAMRKAK